MKRYGNLYETICTFDNLLLSYRKARLGKRYKFNVLKFSYNLEEKLCSILDSLLDGTYEPGDYFSFKVFEPKERIIMALPFRDRVVQHALVNIIEPIFEKSFIYDSYACRIGKGAHKGMIRAKQFIRKAGRGCWILKADVQKFFPSIDNAILKKILARKIKCSKTLQLCYQYIDGDTGIPIGNLTSQLYANVYLNELDHYIKDVLGVKLYIRYMDDFVIVCKTKEEANALKQHLSAWLSVNLHLTLNSKTQIYPERNGVNFLGYRVWYDGIKIRHTTVRRLKRKIKRFNDLKARGIVTHIIPVLMSWKGMAKWGNCKTIEDRIMLLLGEIK